MQRGSMRSSGGSEAASAQMARRRSCAAWPERISSTRTALISASCRDLKSVSRECDFAFVACGADGIERISVQFEAHDAGILGGNLEMIGGVEEVILSGFHRSIKHDIFVRHHNHFRSLRRHNLQFES